ncbi:hypothetical protein MMRN_p1150 (plasmid) [Mycobacterium marinum]|nr:hypothetical protein MMRN_p1150 [Mycobacterium marinum]GJO46670.1 hypothetical protein NJB1604_27040 [Mycobacterium marinum]
MSPFSFSTPPTPDVHGNPPCDGFLTDDPLGGAEWAPYSPGPGELVGIRVPIYKANLQLPDDFTIVVQTKDGKHHTEEAVVDFGATGAWDSAVEYDFLFPTIDPADVQEVLLTNSKGTCWVQGPVGQSAG